MTTRGRKSPGSHNDGSRAHTSREWAFAREVRLDCPAGHVLGTARQDTARTSVSPANRDSDNPNPAPTLEFAGPPDDLMRTVRWSCPACDRRARATGRQSRSGGYRRHQAVTSAGPLLALLEAMRTHGPRYVRVRIDQVPERVELVTSGEQLRRAQAFSGNPSSPQRSAQDQPVRTVARDPLEFFASSPDD